jgi:hypothetical protein
MAFRGSEIEAHMGNDKIGRRRTSGRVCDPKLEQSISIGAGEPERHSVMFMMGITIHGCLLQTVVACRMSSIGTMQTPMVRHVRGSQAPCNRSLPFFWHSGQLVLLP